MSAQLHTRNCSVPGCMSEGLKLITFPKNHKRIKEWISLINNPALLTVGHFNLRRHYGVCEKHFPDGDHNVPKITEIERSTAIVHIDHGYSLMSKTGRRRKLMTPTLGDHNYAFFERPAPKREAKLWCYGAANKNAKPPSSSSNLHQEQKPENQINGGKVHPILGDSSNTSLHKDAVESSWSSEPFDNGLPVGSPASVKSESVETAEDWYRGAVTRVCRVCLRVSDDVEDMKPVMQDGMPTELGLTMQRLLQDVLISASDALPKQLCGACADDALRAENFLRQARQTQHWLAGLEPADVAEDIFQRWTLSRYLPSDKTRTDDGDVFVSLRFDGENLLLENTEETVEEEECGSEEKHVEENTCTTDQTSDETEAFEECGVFAEPYEEVVQYFDDAISLDDSMPSISYDLTGSPKNDQALELPLAPSKRRRSDHADPPLASAVCVSANSDDERALELPSAQVKRSRHEHPDPPLATAVYVPGSRDDGRPLELPAQFNLSRRGHLDPPLNIGVSGNPDDGQTLELPSAQFQLNRREQNESPLATEVYLSELPSAQFQRNQREHPDSPSATEVYLSELPSAQFKGCSHVHPDPSLITKVYVRVSGSSNDAQAMMLSSAPVRRIPHKSPSSSDEQVTKLASAPVRRLHHESPSSKDDIATKLTLAPVGRLFHKSPNTQTLMLTSAPVRRLLQKPPSSNDVQALKLTSEQVRRILNMPPSSNDTQAPHLISTPARRLPHKSPVLAASLHKSDRVDDEKHLDDSFMQRLSETCEDTPSPGASLCENLDPHTARYVTVKKADQLFQPVLTCSHCGYKTRLKSRLRRHMRTQHDRRLAPRLRPRATSLARS